MWLCRWLPGRNVREAQEVAGEELLLSHPQWGLQEARLVDVLLKDVLYRTHRKVEISGVIICRCRNVTRETIRDAIATDPTMAREDLTIMCKASCIDSRRCSPLCC